VGKTTIEQYQNVVEEAKKTLPGEEFEARFNPAHIAVAEQSESTRIADEQYLADVKIKTIEILYDIFKKWYDITKEDLELIDIMIATACERRIPGDPLWFYLVGPSGMLKTDLCRSIGDIDEVYSLDKLTPRTLISGMTERDKKTGELKPIAGIIKQLDGRTLVIKDFTSILSMNEDNRNEVIGQLRAAYDGYLEQAYGTLPHPIREYATFGFVGAVTPILDKYTTVLVTMGPRCLIARVHGRNYEKAALKAIQNAGHEGEMRGEVRHAVKAFVDKVDWKREVDVSETYQKRIVALATYVAYTRTHVFAKYYKGQIQLTELPTTESPTRLAKQMKKLVTALVLIRNHETITSQDYETLVRVAKDTAIPEYQMIVDYYMKNGLNNPATTYDISIGTGLNFQTVENKMLLMQAIGIAGYDMKETGEEKNKDREEKKTYSVAWKLTSLFRELITKSGMLGTGKP
jgi:hypothetical protein